MSDKKYKICMRCCHVDILCSGETRNYICTIDNKIVDACECCNYFKDEEEKDGR